MIQTSCTATASNGGTGKQERLRGTKEGTSRKREGLIWGRGKEKVAV
jgi:hypothetical protein